MKTWAEMAEEFPRIEKERAEFKRKCKEHHNENLKRECKRYYEFNKQKNNSIKEKIEGRKNKMEKFENDINEYINYLEDELDMKLNPGYSIKHIGEITDDHLHFITDSVEDFLKIFRFLIKNGYTTDNGYEWSSEPDNMTISINVKYDKYDRKIHHVIRLRASKFKELIKQYIKRKEERNEFINKIRDD